MIADTIRLLLSNLPVVFCLGALLAGATLGRPEPWPDRYLSWLLLLAVGADGVWAGFFHVFLPEIASRQIGWQPSPFEFEVGIADLSLGMVAILSFWRRFEFKAAIAVYAILFHAGVSIGHVIQAFGDGDVAPDNFGTLLILTILRAGALTWLLLACSRNHATESARQKRLAA
ncbi:MULTISPECIES: DUF6790 family protein [unclassified Sinorhizobium]|uniref:DUF6790 family protein n=1 Tax=unclassified Sinorhizobium TaxID=2613772 RepID=UPI0035256EEF